MGYRPQKSTLTGAMASRTIKELMRIKKLLMPSVSRKQFVLPSPPTRRALRLIFRLSLGAVFVAIAIKLSSSGIAQTSSPTTEKSVTTPAKQLSDEQLKLAEKYQLLEDKLFSLYEFEQGSNPARSDLLQRAFQQSQLKMTAMQLKTIGQLLANSKLNDAERQQESVVLQLKQLLDLLESEDRGKRVRDELQRHQEYLKEVERLLRIQTGIRGLAEGGVDGRRLAQSESKAAERTDRLARQVAEHEQSDKEQTENRNPSKQKDTNNADAPENESDDGEPGDNGNPNGPGSPGDASPNPDSDQSGSLPNEDQPAQPQPLSKRIAAAEQRMQDAQKKLDRAQRDDAIDDMKAAEMELAAAKKDLEEILRQLREEEIERTLAMLETRFRQMLIRQVKVLDTTQKIDRVPDSERGPDFQIQTGKLSVEQTGIATDAARALMLLKEDGTSVAFPVTVEDMQQDMLQVASRLAAAKIGSFTIELEEDIIETLNYIIKSLVQTQQDLAKMKQGQQSAGGDPGDRPLVDQLAEIKMLRGLQERIHKRHERYARLLADPEDSVGATEDPEMQSALDRLAQRQSQLTEIARDIVSEKNQ